MVFPQKSCIFEIAAFEPEFAVIRKPVVRVAGASRQAGALRHEKSVIAPDRQRVAIAVRDDQNRCVLWGVGPATTAKMHRLGIHIGLDLRARTLPFLTGQFGKAGHYYYWAARSVDERPVRADSIWKLVGAENTFAPDLSAFEAMREALQPVIDKVWRHCENAGVPGRTVVLKVKYADFHLITRSRTLAAAVADRAALERISLDLLAALMPVPKGVRLLGVTLAALEADGADGPRQMRLAL
jgi:DNA polymerase IV